mmetsp:Transcript_31230/g.60873  ORF Transcript_31230/g.60873 Transcript_31230/m.60873 type:complete len:225 (-) Transcript_31230:101-775(-)
MRWWLLLLLRDRDLDSSLTWLTLLLLLRPLNLPTSITSSGAVLLLLLLLLLLPLWCLLLLRWRLWLLLLLCLLLLLLLLLLLCLLLLCLLLLRLWSLALLSAVVLSLLMSSLLALLLLLLLAVLVEGKDWFSSFSFLSELGGVSSPSPSPLSTLLLPLLRTLCSFRLRLNLAGCSVLTCASPPSSSSSHAEDIANVGFLGAGILNTASSLAFFSAALLLLLNLK